MDTEDQEALRRLRLEQRAEIQALEAQIARLQAQILATNARLSAVERDITRLQSGR